MSLSPTAVLANIWQTNRIARINPRTGAVTGWIDMTGVPEARNRRDADAVLNGIAYDAAKDRLFVTGKNWPHLYEIALTQPKHRFPLAQDLRRNVSNQAGGDHRRHHPSLLHLIMCFT